MSTVTFTTPGAFTFPVPAAAAGTVMYVRGIGGGGGGSGGGGDDGDGGMGGYAANYFSTSIVIPKLQYIYATAGTYTIPVPANATQVSVIAIGAGGGGGGGGAYGGGSGGYIDNTFDVTPGSTITAVVGAGGYGGSAWGGSPESETKYHGGKGGDTIITINGTAHTAGGGWGGGGDMGGDGIGAGAAGVGETGNGQAGHNPTPRTDVGRLNPPLNGGDGAPSYYTTLGLGNSAGSGGHFVWAVIYSPDYTHYGNPGAYGGGGGGGPGKAGVSGWGGQGGAGYVKIIFSITFNGFVGTGGTGGTGANRGSNDHDPSKFGKSGTDTWVNLNGTVFTATGAQTQRADAPGGGTCGDMSSPRNSIYTTWYNIRTAGYNNCNGNGTDGAYGGGGGGGGSPHTGMSKEKLPGSSIVVYANSIDPSDYYSVDGPHHNINGTYWNCVTYVWSSGCGNGGHGGTGYVEFSYSSASTNPDIALNQVIYAHHLNDLQQRIKTETTRRSLAQSTYVSPYIITTAGSYTYTVPAGATASVFIFGAGGGGAGTNGGYASTVSCGGGSGGYQLITGIAAGTVLSGVIGTGGAGGNNSTINGGTGGNTTLIASGTTYVATGGGGASGSNGGTPGVGGVTGGVAGNYVNGASGGSGAQSYYTTLTGLQTAGAGGVYMSSTMNGNNGLYGGGGGGASGSHNAGIFGNGGNGGNGVVYIMLTVSALTIPNLNTCVVGSPINALVEYNIYRNAISALNTKNLTLPLGSTKTQGQPISHNDWQSLYTSLSLLESQTL